MRNKPALNLPLHVSKQICAAEIMGISRKTNNNHHQPGGEGKLQCHVRKS